MFLYVFEKFFIKIRNTMLLYTNAVHKVILAGKKLYNNGMNFVMWT